MATTASEIAGYRGDLSTGLGSSDGAGANAIYGEGEFSKTEKAVDSIFLHTFQKNKDAFERKQKQQDDIRTALQSEQMNIGRLLPKDREYIKSNYSDKIHDLLIKNPNIASDNTKYQELLGLMDGFREAKAYGGVRLVTVAGMDSDISKELDPEKKARMQSHRDKLYGQTIFENPMPFQQALDYDPKVIFTEPAPISTQEESLDFEGNKVNTRIKSVTPFKDFTVDTYNRYMDANNTTAKNQMDEFVKSFHTMPPQLQQEKVMQWNEKIAQGNKDAGYKPGDTYYVKPIQMDVVDGQPVITATTPDIVRAQAILLNYKNTDSTTSKVSDLAGKIAKDMADAKKTLAETKTLIPAEAYKLYADAAKARADANKTGQEEKDLKEAAKTAEGSGSYAVDQTLQTFNPNSYQGLPYADGKTMTFTDNAGVKHTSRAPAGLKGTVVMYKDEKGAVITGLGDQQMNALGLRFKGGKDGTSVFKPESVVYNTENKEAPFFIAKYDVTPAATTENPKPERKIETRIITPQEFLTGAIKNITGEDAAGKESEVYTHAINEWKKRTGSTNVNGTTLTEVEKPEYRAKTSLYQEKKNLFKD